MFVVGGERSVDRAPFDDALRADDAGVADVDHVPVGDVERDAESDQEHQADDQHARPEADRDGFRSRATTDQPEHSPEQVEQRRIDERNRRVDARVVEEGEREREREQGQQVEVHDRKRPAKAHERREEKQAQRQPHVERRDVAAERAAVAARHRPRDLDPGPSFDGLTVEVVDYHLADLAAVRSVEADLPAPAALQVGDRVGTRVFGQHASDRRLRRGDRDGARRREPARGHPLRVDLDHHELARGELGRGVRADRSTHGRSSERRSGREGQQARRDRSQAPHCPSVPLEAEVSAHE